MGADVFGDLIKSQLGDEGVDVAGVARTEEIGTSKTVILDVPGEDRRYIHTIGANAAVRAADLDAVTFPTVTYCSSVATLSFPALTLTAWRLAWPRPNKLAPGPCSTFVCPPTERCALKMSLPCYLMSTCSCPTRTKLASCREPKSPVCRPRFSCPPARGGGGHQRCRGCPDGGRQPAGVAACSRGRSGGRLRSRGRVCRGFICGLVEGWPLERSFAFATAVGASACTALGCTAGVFSRQQAEDFVISHSLAPA